MTGGERLFSDFPPRQWLRRLYGALATRWAFALLAGAAFWVCLSLADYAAPRGGLLGAREVLSNRTLFVEGLRAHAPVTVDLRLAARRDTPIVLRSMKNVVGEAVLRPAGAVLSVASTTDADGRVGVRIEGRRRQEFTVRVLGLDVRQHAAGHLPIRRQVAYGFNGVFVALLGLRRFRRQTAARIIILSLLLLITLIMSLRCQVVPRLMLLAVALGLLELGLMIAGCLVRRLGVTAAAARWFAFSFLLKMTLVVQPSFKGVDLDFHLNRLIEFRSGAVVASKAPGLRSVPYPPLLYALLQPFSLDDDVNRLLIRATVGLLEGTAPLLVLALALALGATKRTASSAMTAAAVMPEGVLVLAKMIACNVLGSYLTLLAAIALLRGAGAPLVIGLLCLLLLSHAPAAATATALLCAWWALAAVRRETSARVLVGRLASLLAACAIVWLVYYRESTLVVGEPFAVTTADTRLFGVRSWRLGKVLQDVVLKFGLGPLLLAVAAFVRGGLPARYRSLVWAWTAVGLVFGLAAVLTPFPLRFEYFLMVPVAVCAGWTAERLEGQGRGRIVAWAWSVAMLIQVALGLLYYAGRFEIISVILESPRWPFPVRL